MFEEELEQVPIVVGVPINRERWPANRYCRENRSCRLQLNRRLGAEDPTRKELAELTTLKGLASDWQWAAGKALKGVEQSLALFWGR
jgi:hypothetical protein